MNIDCGVRNIHCGMQTTSIQGYGVICISQSISFRLSLWPVKMVLAYDGDYLVDQWIMLSGESYSY